AWLTGHLFRAGYCVGKGRFRGWVCRSSFNGDNFLGFSNLARRRFVSSWCLLSSWCLISSWRLLRSLGNGRLWLNKGLNGGLESGLRNLVLGCWQELRVCYLRDKAI